MAKNHPLGKNKKAKVSPARQAVLVTLRQVFAGQSLSAVQRQTIDKLEDRRDRGLANEVVNGVLRWRWQLEFFVCQLLSKPLKQKDSDVQLILMMALYELNECRTPDYAIINEAVELVRSPSKIGAGKKWAAGLVNAVLRRFSREKDQIISSMTEQQAIYSHPWWLLKKLKQDWPDDWQQIVSANNKRPAFWLRVNQLQHSVGDYRELLTASDINIADTCDDLPMDAVASSAVCLEKGIDVRLLPGFSDGAVSVQDIGAQLTAGLLNVSAVDSVSDCRVLDLCAAPGGKTCHLLEQHLNLEMVTAVELEEKRMLRVTENLQRLKLESRANLIVGDAREPQQWWDGKKFDRILVDAPCSASGIIRRHPDIKTLRRDTDIEPLSLLQSEILVSAWQMLESGGELLYVTCSVFRDENQHQIELFLAAHADAAEIVIDAQWGKACSHGRQLLPGEMAADGFYFCRLKKIIA